MKRLLTKKKQHPKNIARTYHPQREDVTQIHNFYYDRLHRLVRLLHYYDKNLIYVDEKYKKKSFVR